MKTKIISNGSSQLIQKRIQYNIDYLLSGRTDRKQLLSLKQYEQRIQRYISQYIVSADPQKLAVSLRKLIDRIDLGIVYDSKKLSSTVRVNLPSTYRHDFNFPTAITEDIVLGRIILTLKTGTDHQLMNNSIKGYLINYANEMLEERLIGQKAAQMILEAKSLQLIAPQLELFQSKLTDTDSIMPTGILSLQNGKSSLQQLGELYLVLKSQNLDKLGWGFQKLSYLHFNYQNNKTAFEVFVLPQQLQPMPIIRDLFKPLQDIDYLRQQLSKKVLTSFWQKILKNWITAIAKLKQIKPIVLKRSEQAGEFLIENGKNYFSYFKKTAAQLTQKTFQLLQNGTENLRSAGEYFKQISLARYQKRIQQILLTMPLVLLSFLLAGDKLEDKVDQTVFLEITEITDFEDFEDQLPEIANISINQSGLLSTTGVIEVLPEIGPATDQDIVVEERRLVSGLYYYEDSQLNFQNNLNLTFDDGPNLEKIIVSIDGKDVQKTVTGHILDVLKEHNVKATFFINAKNFGQDDTKQYQEQRELLQRMIDEGHLIANHTYHHHNLTRGEYNDGVDDVEQIKQEIVLNQQALDDILGYHYQMEYFRPPYAEGGRNSKVDRAVAELGMKMIILQVDSYDYRNAQNSNWDSADILNNLKGGIVDSNGGTILMHDLSITARLLEESLENIFKLENSRGGFSLVSLEKLINIKAESILQLSAISATIDTN